MPKSHNSNMFINLISGQAANQAKALRFGRKFLAAGWGVTLSINIEAVNLADSRAQLDPCPVSGQSLRDILRAFLAEGGKAVVGKECMGLAGIAAADLMEGLQVATFPETEKTMAIPDLKIITW